MRRIWQGALMMLAIAGCDTIDEERVHDYNHDGVFLYQQGNYARASECFQAALALQPEDPGLQYNLGASYDRMGNSAKAEEYYNKCLGREPGHAACRHAQVMLLVKTGRTPQAKCLVADWLAREPKRADAYALDGWLLHQSGYLPEAQTRLQQALDLEPQNKYALVELGLVYEALQRPERAIVLYERVLANEPNHPEVTQRLNFLLAKGVKRPLPD